jgi:predicted alpha/beta hydrolase family esterase
MKTQVVIIHGGNAFNTYKEYILFLKKVRLDFGRYLSNKKNWKGTIGAVLGKKFEVLLPDMPNKMNAHYAEWKIWFEKFIPHLRKEVVLVGHSLGGAFLVKYLSENTFPKKVRATFLVAPAFREGSFRPPQSLKKLEKQGGAIFLYHSSDDRVVPAADFEKYRNKLKGAVTRAFKDRGHFNQERFPELARDIKKCSVVRV